MNEGQRHDTLTSFGLVVLAYAYLIRRVNLLRFLFGMRPLAQAAQPQVVRRAASS